MINYTLIGIKSDGSHVIQTFQLQDSLDLDPKVHEFQRAYPEVRVTIAIESGQKEGVGALVYTKTLVRSEYFGLIP